MARRRLLFVAVSAVFFFTGGVWAADEQGLMPTFFYYQRSPRVSELLKACTNWSAADAGLYFEIALDHLGKDRFDEAAWGLMRAVRIDTNNSAYRYWLGRTYARMSETAASFSRGRWALKAVDEYQAAVRLDPGNIEARRALIDHYANAPAFCGGDKRKAEQERELMKAQLAAKNRKMTGPQRK
jgi:tetratricopeptide (TPR) repeat protein